MKISPYQGNSCGVLPGETDTRGTIFTFLGYEFDSEKGRWIIEDTGEIVQNLNLPVPTNADTCPYSKYGEAPKLLHRPDNLCTVCLFEKPEDNEYKLIGIESEFLRSFFDTHYSFYKHKNGMVHFR